MNFKVEEAYPSFSHICKELGLIDLTHIPQWALDRGRRVHEACWMFDTGQGVKKIEPDELPYLKAWERFREEFPVPILHCEREFANRVLKYTARPDVVLDWDGPLVVERKLGKPKDIDLLETAAQAMCFNPWAERAAIYLGKDGDYKRIWHRDPADFTEWKNTVRKYYTQVGS